MLRYRHDLFTPDTRTYRGHVAHFHDGPNNSWNIHSWRVITRVGWSTSRGRFPRRDEHPTTRRLRRVESPG